MLVSSALMYALPLCLHTFCREQTYASKDRPSEKLLCFKLHETFRVRYVKILTTRYDVFQFTQNI